MPRKRDERPTRYHTFIHFIRPGLKRPYVVFSTSLSPPTFTMLARYFPNATIRTFANVFKDNHWIVEIPILLVAAFHLPHHHLLLRNLHENTWKGLLLVKRDIDCLLL